MIGLLCIMIRGIRTRILTSCAIYMMYLRAYSGR